jgi:hypothetical protein
VTPTVSTFSVERWQCWLVATPLVAGLTQVGAVGCDGCLRSWCCTTVARTDFGVPRMRVRAVGREASCMVTSRDVMALIEIPHLCHRESRPSIVPETSWSNADRCPGLVSVLGGV